MFVAVSIIITLGAVLAWFFAGVTIFGSENYPWWQEVLSILIAIALTLGIAASISRAKDDQRKHSDRQATRCEQIGGTPKYSKHTLNYTSCEGLDQG